MRSYLLGIACLFASATISFAQDAPAPEHHEEIPYLVGSEVIIGHGFLPSEQMFMNNHRYNTNQYSGAVAATYRYHVNDVISLGLAFAYEYEQGTYNDYNYNYYYPNNYYYPIAYNNYGTFTRSSFTIAPEITFNYGDFANGHIRLYSVIGMGYTFRDEVITDQYGAEYTSPYVRRVHFNAYGCPLGVRAGGRLSGFFELGMGYKGVLNYGVTYRF